MARKKSLVIMIRDLVREQVEGALASMLGAGATSKRRRGKWRPGGPGRPPKAVAARRRKKR
jgi:hypothetical protein